MPGEEVDSVHGDMQVRGVGLHPAEAEGPRLQQEALRENRTCGLHEGGDDDVTGSGCTSRSISFLPPFFQLF